MITEIFTFFNQINDFIWGYIGLLLISSFGLYFTFTSNCFQISKFSKIFKLFFSFFKEDSKNTDGVHPLKTFFASIGGCIGIGNIVGVCTAVQIGGPGALFWTWIAGFLGMILLYSEVFLGMTHRVKNQTGGFDGGPMYFLPKAYKKKWVGTLVAFLLCIYGVELFMFNVITDSIVVNWHINKFVTIGALLSITFFAAIGGVQRVGKICAAIIPLFLILYLFMSLYILFHNFHLIPDMLLTVFQAAFSPQAASGAFAGSTIILTISMGLSRGAYSGDIGVGFSSVIHSESSANHPHRQAALTIIGIFLDTFVICTLSIFLVLITHTWNEPIDVTLMIQNSLSKYFPYMEIFMPFFLFLLGFSTLISYFVVGIKCAKFISPTKGKPLYYTYALLSFPLFAFVDPTEAFIIMSLSGAFLLILNLTGIYLLRKDVCFKAFTNN